MNEIDLLTAALRNAGEAGLKRAGIAKAISAGVRMPKASKEAALGRALELVASIPAVNVGTEKTPRFILAEFDRRRERACEAILARATPGEATVFNAAALRKGHARGTTRPIVDEAIEILRTRRELFVIKPGKIAFYLHARSLAPLMPERAALPAEDAFSAETVRGAYAELVRDGGFRDVSIASLARRSGVGLGSLQHWLLAESRAGRAAPTRGDWSLADADARAAAIEIRGEPHLQIRLLP